MIRESESDGRTTRHRHRRPQLLATLADHVAERGLRRASMRSLGAAAGVSHAALLHHFGTKEQLIAEVLVELRQRDRLRVAARLAELADDPPRERVIAAWAALAPGEHTSYWRAFFDAYSLALAEPDRYGQFLDGLVTDWVELVAGLLSEQVNGDRREAVATLLLAAIRGLILDLLATADGARVEAGVAALADMVESVSFGVDA